jgi:hypothetical protein
VVLRYYLCSSVESRFLVSWCAGGRCDMMGNDEDLGRSRRPNAEDRRWSSTGRILGGRMIEISGDTVYSLYRAREDEVSWLNLKSKVDGFLILASKSSRHRFIVCAIKPIERGRRGTRIESGYGFPV